MGIEFVIDEWILGFFIDELEVEMSYYITQAVIALQKVRNRESLDECDVAIIDRSLTRTIQEGRTLFQRFRDHYIIGSERFRILDGFDYYRTILLHRKSSVWYQESDMSELSVFDVYTGAQLEPKQIYNYDSNDATPEEYAEEILNRGHIGPSFGGAFQAELDDEAIRSLRNYIAELSGMDTRTAIEHREELDVYLRNQTPGSTFIADGNLDAVLGAFIRKGRFRSKPRALLDHRKKTADLVRRSTDYARKVLRKNPMTAEIADHLEEYVRIGQICEYRGDWKWKF